MVPRTEARLHDHTAPVRVKASWRDRLRSVLGVQVHPPGARNGVPQGVRLAGAPLLWEAGIDGRGQVIANIDTGVAATHPDLQTCPDGRPKILSFRDYVGRHGELTPTSPLYGKLQPGSAIYDDNGHGTHTAGTMAANGAIRGMAPGAQLRVYKVMDQHGGAYIRDIARAINDAVADGCRIISLSLGASFRPSSWTEAIRRAVAAGCRVIVAAGNEGPGAITWPAYEAEVISVGAVKIDPETGQLTIAHFSTTNKEVDLAAYGEDVLSTWPDGHYATQSGTSMGCPHVSGMCALLDQLGEERLGEPLTEPAAWQGLKTRSVRLPGTTREQAGAGYSSLYTSLPRTRTVAVKIGVAGRWVDGVFEPTDKAPKIEDARTLCPPRHTHEPMGDEVLWDQDNWTATFRRWIVPGMEV